MNTRRAVAVVCGFCLMVALLRYEWKWGLPEISFLRRVATAIIPLAVLMTTGFVTGAFRYRGSPRRLFLILLGASLFGAIVISHRVAPSGVLASVRPDFYVVLAQMAVCAAIGYWMARDARDVHWMLSRCALCLAAISVFGGITRVLGMEQSNPYLVPAFPVALTVMFGHCWYLSQWLNGPRRSIWPLLGILACSPMLLMTFHKPIVFGLVVSSAFISVHSMWATRRVYTILTRGALLLVIGCSMFFVADAASSNQISARLEDKIRDKYLHQTVAARYESFGETLERMSAGRIQLAKNAIAIFVESPLVGTGFGQKVGKVGEMRSAVHVHNGYLDLLISAGVVGALPVFGGIIWWFTLALRRSVAAQMGPLIIPCVGFTVSVMAYNLGGVSRSFFALNSFAIFIMAITVGLADQALAMTGERNRYYNWLARFSSRRPLRHADGRS